MNHLWIHDWDIPSEMILGSIKEHNYIIPHLHNNMASQKSIICKNIVIAHFAVMGNMRRSHYEIVVTNDLLVQYLMSHMFTLRKQTYILDLKFGKYICTYIYVYCSFIPFCPLSLKIYGWMYILWFHCCHQSLGSIHSLAKVIKWNILLLSISISK